MQEIDLGRIVDGQEIKCKLQVRDNKRLPMFNAGDTIWFIYDFFIPKGLRNKSLSTSLAKELVDVCDLAGAILLYEKDPYDGDEVNSSKKLEYLYHKFNAKKLDVTSSSGKETWVRYPEGYSG